MRTLFLPLLLIGSGAFANSVWEITGQATIEQRYFLQDALYAEQSRGQLSAYLSPEFYRQWNDGYDSIVFKPFYRIDQRDSERTHADIRELVWLHVGDDWELRAGIGKEFWGQTESLHLVDIINQTDAVEAVDGEDKLGQPMLNVQLIRDWGTTSFYLLPYFRERTFAGLDGRLRLPHRVDVDNPIYESGDKQKHLDWAVRWQHSLGDWEVGLSYFDGTSREPGLVAESNNNAMLFRPYYGQIQQVGLDLLAVVDAWLLKLEAIHRKGSGQDYVAAVGGFEYTFVGVLDSVYDIGWLMEYQYDERDQRATTPGQNDLMLGSRIAFNDIDGTEILLGWVQDLDHSHSRSAFVEASSRINDNWKWNFNAWFFSSQNSAEISYLYRRDDFIEFSLEYYF